MRNLAHTPNVCLFPLFVIGLLIPPTASLALTASSCPGSWTSATFSVPAVNVTCVKPVVAVMAGVEDSLRVCGAGNKSVHTEV